MLQVLVNDLQFIKKQKYFTGIQVCINVADILRSDND